MDDKQYLSQLRSLLINWLLTLLLLLQSWWVLALPILQMKHMQHTCIARAVM
jgi:hypothetical protein